jgi:hypothetical protein
MATVSPISPGAGDLRPIAPAKPAAVTVQPVTTAQEDVVRLSPEAVHLIQAAGLAGYENEGLGDEGPFGNTPGEVPPGTGLQLVG